MHQCYGKRKKCEKDFFFHFPPLFVNDVKSTLGGFTLIGENLGSALCKSGLREPTHCRTESGVKRDKEGKRRTDVGPEKKKKRKK